MESQLELLKQLQDIDSIICRNNDVETGVPKKLSQLEKERSRRQQQFEKEQSALEKVAENRRRMEQKLKQEYDRIERSEEKLHLVKTNKEYHAALKEIEEIKQSNSELETEILLCMEEADRLSQLLKAQETEQKEWMEGYYAQQNAFQADIERCKEETVELERRRAETVEKIDSPLMNKYELLRQKRQGIAVVPITNGLCQGCNMKIPPQVSIELRRDREAINVCPFCNRIIYFDGDQAGSET